MKASLAALMVVVLPAMTAEVDASEAELIEILAASSSSMIESDFAGKRVFFVYSGAPVQEVYTSNLVSVANKLGRKTGILEPVEPDKEQNQVVVEFNTESTRKSCEHRTIVNDDGAYGTFADFGETYGIITFSGDTWLNGAAESEVNACISDALLSFYGVKNEVTNPQNEEISLKILAKIAECSSQFDKAAFEICLRKYF